MGIPGSLEEPDRLNRLEITIEKLDGELKHARGQINLLRGLIVLGILSAAAVYGLPYLVAAGILPASLLVTKPAAKIESVEFGLYNRPGQRVILADDDKWGNPNLIFFDLQKRYRMDLKIWPEGGGTPGLSFFDGAGRRGFLRMDEDEGSVLSLFGEGQKGSATLAVTKDGKPSLRLVDASGKVVFEVPEGAFRSGSAPATLPGREGNPARSTDSSGRK